MQDIVPRSTSSNASGRALIKKRRFRILIAIVATVIGAGLLARLFYTYWNSYDWMFYAYWNNIDWTEDEPGVVYVLLVLVVIPLLSVLALYGLLSFWVGAGVAAHQESLREVIVAAVCRFFDGLKYTRVPGARFDHKRFFKLGVVPGGSEVPLKDMFIGRHRDTAFRMVDAEVTQVDDKHTHTVFDGRLIEIDIPAEVSGRVLIGDKEKIDKVLKGLFFSKWTRVQFDHPDFEDRYAVYASDADEARRLVSPGFCDNMLTLADAYGTLGAAVVDGVFLLAVPVPGDLFEPGSINRSVYDCEGNIHEFLKQLTIAHRFIDCLHGDRPERPA